MFKHILIKRLRAFGEETRASVTVEFALVMPFIFWAFMASYVYFDGYRQSSVNLKAAYTISDLISRETGVIDAEYIDSMHSLLRLLTRATSPTSIRISVIRWDEPDDRYYVDWSQKRGFPAALSNNDMAMIEEKLPVMPHNERVILVETLNLFVPLFNFGMDNVDL